MNRQICRVFSDCSFSKRCQMTIILPRRADSAGGPRGTEAACRVVCVRLCASGKELLWKCSLPRCQPSLEVVIDKEGSQMELRSEVEALKQLPLGSSFQRQRAQEPKSLTLPPRIGVQSQSELLKQLQEPRHLRSSLAAQIHRQVAPGP